MCFLNALTWEIPVSVSFLDSKKEKKMKTAHLLASLFMIVVAVAHLLRLIFQTQVVVGSTVMPVWMSVFGMVVPAFIAWLLWRESRR